MNRLAPLLFASIGILAVLAAQQPDFHGVIPGDGARPSLAVPDFRGDAKSQPLMAVFNETLWNDLDDSAFFRMVPKTQYPIAIPQQPSDLRTTAQDWSMPPARAIYLAAGYSAVQNGTLAVRGWLMDLRVTAGASFDKPYGESPDAAGARKAAHRFAADILKNFGVTPLFGTHIYFVHESRPIPDRQTEIWMMDADGGNQRRLAHDNSVFTQPAISPDGTMVAFVRVFPKAEIMMYSVDRARAVPFANQSLSAAAAPSFTPDGRQLLFAQSVKGEGQRIFIANADGTNQRPLTLPGVFDTEPKVNPKTGTQIAFVSGRSRHAQIYTMNIDGTGTEHLSDGVGEAAHPSWHPNGRFLAFASTHGVGANNWNICVVDVATGHTLQLTHDEGKNENPVWAPDGSHLVFMSNRTGKSQVWSMLADGTHLHQLTTDGVNGTPVWGN